MNKLIAPIVHFFTVCLLLLAFKVSADDEKFYLGALVGQARGDVGATEMNERMAALGYDAEANVSHQNRTAWELLAGYKYSNYLSLEAGYIDLGEVRTRLRGSVVDINDYLTSANLVHPRSASGYELAVLGRYPLNEKNYLYLRAGLLFANSRYEADAEVEFAKRSNSGRDGFIGIGYGYEISDHWGLRLSFENYRVEDENIGLLGLGVQYKFHHHKTTVASREIVTVAPAVAIKKPQVIVDPCAQPDTATENCKPPLMKPMSIKLAVQFDTNSDLVKDIYLADIGKLADFMKQHSNIKVTIEGHTDDRGNDYLNKMLSQRRAHSVRNILIQQFGITSDRVNFVGYGEERPVADNTSEQGRTANRRVMAEVTTNNSK
jgi:outer membrane protein OmpA-like peptidoglycan-associated protein